MRGVWGCPASRVAVRWSVGVCHRVFNIPNHTGLHFLPAFIAHIYHSPIHTHGLVRARIILTVVPLRSFHLAMFSLMFHIGCHTLSSGLGVFP